MPAKRVRKVPARKPDAPKFNPTLTVTGAIPSMVVQVGDRMRQARVAAGAQQTEMAQVLEVSRQTIIDWEGNKRVPSVPVLFAWAHITNVDYTWLRYGESPKIPHSSSGVLALA